MDMEKEKKWVEEKKKEAEKALDKMMEEYYEMTKEQLHDRLSMQDDDTLKWICNDVAIPREKYEICQMAKSILEQRGANL